MNIKQTPMQFTSLLCNAKAMALSTVVSSVLIILLLPLSKLAQADINATHTSLVSEFASFNTPGVLDGRVEAIAIDGDTVFDGGSFTQIQEPLDGQIINQPYLFAYSKSSGNIIRSFDPVLNNTVLALESTGEGRGVFVGGVFNILNGQTNNRGLVKLDDNGDRVSSFTARPDALVSSMVRLDNTLYIGGNFRSVGQTPVEFLAAVDTTTGDVDPSLNLDFDGSISTTRTNGTSGVDDIDITSDGRLMLITGIFTSIDRISRTRIALLELDGQARVSSWNTDIYDVQCGSLFPQYIQGFDIAPDNSYFIAGSNGGRQDLDPACDTISRFELDDLSDTDVQPTWVNFTGGDSVYDVVATDHAVYAGGHYRWLNNRTSEDGNDAGPGSAERRGFAAIDPKNGLTLLNWRADRNPRGVGVFAMVAEDEGLYFGDDTDFFNGSKHAKFKFLPLSTDIIRRPEVLSLPATLITIDNDALCLLYTSPSPRDRQKSRMPSSA